MWIRESNNDNVSCFLAVCLICSLQSHQGRVQIALNEHRIEGETIFVLFVWRWYYQISNDTSLQLLHIYRNKIIGLLKINLIIRSTFEFQPFQIQAKFLTHCELLRVSFEAKKMKIIFTRHNLRDPSKMIKNCLQNSGYVSRRDISNPIAPQLL